MQKLKYIFFTFSIFTIFSCQTVVEDIKLPYEERMVIQSFISPQDTLLEVKVSKTRPVTGTFPINQFYGNKGFESLEGAIIEISDGNRKGVFQLQTIVNPLSFENDPITGKLVPQRRRGYFLRTKDFPIMAGRTYTLTAKAPNLPDVSASSTVPSRQLIDGKNLIIRKSNTVDSVQNGYSSTNGVITNRYYILSRRFDVTVKDFLSEENYYAIAYYTRNDYQYDDGKGNRLTQINVSQQPYSEFINDYKKDGALLNFKKVNISIGSYSTYPNLINPTALSNVLSIYVAVTDKPYYQYNKALGNSQSINNNDPFSEAVLTYSNFNGGLGIFAGYNMTEVQFDLLK
jgi:hypothetical protein